MQYIDGPPFLYTAGSVQGSRATVENTGNTSQGKPHTSLETYHVQKHTKSIVVTLFYFCTCRLLETAPQLLSTLSHAELNYHYSIVLYSTLCLLCTVCPVHR